MLTYEDFVALGRACGKIGGLDRTATVVKAIRAERPDAILFDGGDTWRAPCPRRAAKVSAWCACSMRTEPRR
ncbi:hypothetical protein [Cribrihabitans pelagius]|uniref:hypothetical protein n=1 Tax=Cribrihabitans pelagius TaxID=1765746 RepID=UPI003B5ACE50